MGPTWVGLVRSYSNRSDALHDLNEITRQLRQAEREKGSDKRRSVASESTPSLWRLRDRLTERAVETLIDSYRAGVPSRELAVRYGFSQTAIKRLLRERGVRRKKLA